VEKGLFFHRYHVYKAVVVLVITTQSKKSNIKIRLEYNRLLYVATALHSRVQNQYNAVW
jgi:hypothetical protein